ncbi:hypothetical protein Tco_0096768 [Tanacetum coccineum]
MSQPANEFSQHLSNDEASNHKDASDTEVEYDIWAIEMEHYLEYIDNAAWKVIQNGNSKKRISIGKDGVIRILPPVTAAEIQAVEKERKAKNILLFLAGFADEVIYSLFAKQSEDWDLLHEDLEYIDDLDIEEIDINWQIAMIAI